MAERRRLFPAGRAALGVGALLLLVSLFLPWFVVTGAQERLSAGTYTGVGSTTLLNDLAQGPWAWAAFGWLTVCVIAAFTSATMGRRVTNFGTSGILVLILFAILVYVAANLINEGVTAARADVTFAYGFFSALVGSALIETGTRIARPAGPPERKPVPATAAADTEKADTRYAHGTSRRVRGADYTPRDSIRDDQAARRGKSFGIDSPIVRSGDRLP